MKLKQKSEFFLRMGLGPFLGAALSFFVCAFAVVKQAAGQRLSFFFLSTL